MPRNGLHLPTRPGRGGRDALLTDPIATEIVSGRWKTPAAGDELTLADGSKSKWTSVSTDAEGRFPIRGGWLLLNIPSDESRAARLDLAGDGSVYVNGEPRPGDPYGFGYLHLPVRLKKGDNEILIQHAGRSPLRIAIVPLKTSAQVDTADTTLPDVVIGENETWKAGLIVRNATEDTLRGLTMSADCGGVVTETRLPPIPPMSFRKVPVDFKAPTDAREGNLDVALKLRGETELDAAKVTVRVVRPNQTHKRTFLSAIDGSVQYYGVNPPAAPIPGARPALFLTLHGASVEGIGQAQAYGSKNWGYLIAPTNRRPYGFDWEDWGRMDAIEVLDLARERFKTDPSRTYLTGHSMGGHGTWIIGATYPDRFAAIAPSAGWISMSSYAGLTPADKGSPLRALMSRAASPSDTLSLAGNYRDLGIYVLHGDADDNVPVTQARRMKEVLAKDHPDFHYFEQPKAGHWWSTPESQGTGAACVDWPPIFDLFARRAVPRPDQTTAVDFTTANPGVSARSGRLTIEAQLKALEPSRVRLAYRPGGRKFVGTTENVARLALATSDLGAEPFTVELDGKTLKDAAASQDGRLHLARVGADWRVVPPPSADLKGPARSGPFKEAFRNRMIFVRGTKGTPEETAWGLAKTRLDAETFQYRGNGAVDIVTDTEFDPAAEPDRNVILYGNAESNGAWKSLLGASPVQVHRGRVVVGSKTVERDDLAVLFVRPRPGSATSSVGVVAGTGPAGLRRTDRLPYFVSGVAYPDLTIIKADPAGDKERGLVAAGFFGEDWSVDKGEILFAEP